MNLETRARNAAARITSSPTGAGVPIKLVSPDAVTADIFGTSTKYHLAVNPVTGELVSARNGSITFSEQIALAAGYVVRDASGEVNLKGHLAMLADSTGIVKTHMIEVWFPDEKMGLIVCILGDYE